MYQRLRFRVGIFGLVWLRVMTIPFWFILGGIPKIRRFYGEESPFPRWTVEY